MPHRYRNENSQPEPTWNLNFGAALREKFKEGYSIKDFTADAMAGVIVGLVALPLAMALAIASGVAPERGVYTVITAGLLIALLGGSRYQVSGPTAAFVVLLLPIVNKFGVAGLLVSGLMAGVILLAMGVWRLGRLIQFIPYPVTTGFTVGIAVVIATIQIKDFFGLTTGPLPENYVERSIELFKAAHTFSWHETTVGLVTLLILIGWPRLTKKIPAPLIALTAASAGVFFLKKYWPDFEVATIGSRFHTSIDGIQIDGIPQTLPAFVLPWNLAGPGGQPFILNLSTIEALVPSAFAIAMLGAIESLLSAVVADGMARTKHDPDAELAAQGVGNIVAPFFGGIAATGAIARTATNIRFGARSPISSAIHALFVLLCLVALAPLVAYLPMASMAALLMIVAYNMSDIDEFFHTLKIAPKSDVATLVLCCGLTILFNMVVGVTVGVVLAALLFIGRMSKETKVQAYHVDHHPLAQTLKLPKDVLLYEVHGPLFFGAAQRAADAMSLVSEGIRVVIVDLSNVHALDVSGLVALDTMVNRLNHLKKRVILTGVSKQPAELILRSALFERKSLVSLCEKMEQALQIASK